MGYRTICRLLRSEGWAGATPSGSSGSGGWRGTACRRRAARRRASEPQGTCENSSRNRPALSANHIWSYNFISARIHRGGGSASSTWSTSSPGSRWGAMCRAPSVPRRSWLTAESSAWRAIVKICGSKVSMARLAGDRAARDASIELHGYDHSSKGSLICSPCRNASRSAGSWPG
jgi:hypothetical protein